MSRSFSSSAYPPATPALTGLLSATDKAKLDGIEASAGVSRLTQSAFTELAADSSTSSTSFSTILTQALTVADSGKLIAWLSYSLTGGLVGAVTAFLRLRLISPGPTTTVLRGTATQLPLLGAAQSGALVWRSAPLDAGSYTVEAQWRASSGTVGAVTCAVAGSPDDSHMSLLVLEVSS